MGDGQMNEQIPIVAIPASNDEGYQLAFEQLPTVIASASLDNWRLSYDRQSDILILREKTAGPSVSYHSPLEPLFVLRLDKLTGKLNGIDLMSYRIVSRKYPTLGEVYSPNSIKRWFRSVRRSASSNPISAIGTSLTLCASH